MRTTTKRLLYIKDLHCYSHKANEDTYFNLLDFNLKAAMWIHQNKNDSGWSEDPAKQHPCNRETLIKGGVQRSCPNWRLIDAGPLESMNPLPWITVTANCKIYLLELLVRHQSSQACNGGFLGLKRWQGWKANHKWHAPRVSHHVVLHAW